MEHLILISTSDSRFIENKKITYGQKYLPYFQKFFPDNYNPETITEGIIYFINGLKNNKANLSDHKPIKINIKKFKLTSNYIFIEFEPSNTVELDSILVKELLRHYLKIKKNINQNEITPYFAIVEKKTFFDLLENEKINLQVNLYEKISQWEKLVNLFEPLDKIEETDFWFKPAILNKIAFALTKLSECSLNIKKQIPDQQKRIQFLQQKKYYRSNCNKIFNRLIELDNLNPSHYSNKAYFHYQNLNELIYPGGRRDGNFFEEVQKALDNFENALDLDFSRINDHYRKGYILAIILPEKITFASDQTNIPDRFKNKKLLIEEGILSFERVLKIYDEQNSPEEFKKRYFNTYLKTLYNLSYVYQSCVLNKNEKLIKLTIKIFPELANELDKDLKPFEYKINLLKKSLEYFEKFVRWVNKKFITLEEEQNLLEIIKYEDSLKTKQTLIQPRLKAYQLGKIYFDLYLSTNDQAHLQQAKKSLILTTQLKKKNPEERDFYIQNLLGQIYIFDNREDLSLKLLEDLSRKNKLDDYIKITLMISYILRKETDKAKKILNELSQKANTLFAKELMFWNFIINELEAKRDEELLKKMGIHCKEKQTYYTQNDNKENYYYKPNTFPDIYSRIVIRIINNR